MCPFLYLNGNLRIFAIFCAAILVLCLIEWFMERMPTSRRNQARKRVAALQWETKRTDRENERLSSPQISPQVRAMKQLNTQHLAAQFQYGLNFPDSES